MKVGAAVDRLRARASAGPIDRWWQVDLLEWFHIPRPQIEVTAGERVAEVYNAIHIWTHTGGVPDSERARLVAWLRSLEQPDGRYAAQDDFERRHPDVSMQASWRWMMPAVEPPAPLGPHSDLVDAFHAIGALRLLGETPNASSAHWLQGRQCEDGAFRSPLSIDASGEPATDDLVDTAAALRTLALLGAQPADTASCTRWLLERAPRVRFVPLAELLDLVAALALVGALDRLELNVASLISRHELDDDHDLYAAARMTQLLDAARRRS